MKDEVNWICEYSKANGSVDVLNVVFVEAYIKNLIQNISLLRLEQIFLESWEECFP